ncbi:hypothetical protein OK016_28080 [Vibrio chagasii]|nr:hypothetical protein [Vibrio chagasii]
MMRPQQLFYQRRYALRSVLKRNCCCSTIIKTSLDDIVNDWDGGQQIT